MQIRINLKLFLLILGLFSLVQINHSQKSGNLIEGSVEADIPFSITQYSLKHGLPQSQVVDIVSKSNGALIISTANGIVEFDGHDFSEIIHYPEYKKYIFLNLFWLEETKYLFGLTSEGSLFMLLPYFKEFGGQKSIQLDDAIYTIGEEGSILKLGPPYETQQEITRIPDLKSRVNCFHVLNNVVYYCTKDGFFSFDFLSKTTKCLSNLLCDHMDYDASNHSIYLLGPKSIHSFSLITNEIKTIFNPINPPENVVIFDIESINENEKFICTNDGFYLLAGESLTRFDKSSFLPSLYFNKAFFVETENCLFLGTGNKGLLKLQLKNCFSLSSQNGFKESTSLNSVITDENGVVFVGSSQSKIYKRQQDSVLVFSNLESGISSLSIINNVINVGTWGDGIFSLTKDGEIQEQIKDSSHFKSFYIHAIFKDIHNRIWVGTGDGVSSGSSLNNLKPFLYEKIRGSIITFYNLKNGTLCIGGSDGVYFVDKNGELLRHITRKDGLRGKEIRSFYEDKEGKLWIGSYNGGLYCYEKEKLTHINALPNCMLSSDAFTLVLDEFGYFNITSNHGLWRVSEAQLNDFYNRKIDYLIPFLYGEEEGIFNTEFNGGFQNNYSKDTFKNLYFPTIEGLIIYKPDSIPFRKLFPSVTKVLLGDIPIEQKNNIVSKDERNIEIHFSSANFLSKYNVYYQFKLERNGQKVAWSSLQKTSSVSYPDLQPGEYVFSLRSIDAINDSNPKIVTLSFTISPYFYETWWFYISIFLLSMLFVGFITYNRIQKQRLKSVQKERQKRKIAQLELIAIQSQMNPHFIFNCLNSIKYFIAINDTLNADIFLDNFSILLRKFIEYSNRPFIQISEEVVLLSAYLELEKYRSNPNFEIELEIEQAVKNKKIPTFIIQPFIENAIKHGILHASHACLLSLRFKLANDFILCEIEDNGIGREKSMAINQSLKHESKGIQLIQDKILTIEELYDLKISYIIEDLYDEKGEAIGTKVTLKIPLKND